MNGPAVALQILVDCVSLEIRLQFTKIIKKRKILFWILKSLRITKMTKKNVFGFTTNRPCRATTKSPATQAQQERIFQTSVV